MACEFNMKEKVMAPRNLLINYSSSLRKLKNNNHRN